MMPTFDTPQPITANIEIAAGSVRLAATERATTVVEVRPLDGSRTADVKAAEQALIDFTNGTLRVSAHRRGLNWGRGGAVTVVVELPAQSVLRAQVASATVRSQGQLGDCRVDAASGDVDLDRTADLKVQTASGEVTVAGVIGRAKLSTASGGVTLGSLDGAATVQTASGRTGIGELRGELKASTASGDITVGEAVQGSLVLSTASGDVQIGIPEGTAARLDVKTASGSVRNGLQSSEGPGDAGQTVSVRARTASGDITVQRPVRTAAV
jgi:hypothetical protein